MRNVHWNLSPTPSTHVSSSEDDIKKLEKKFFDEINKQNKTIEEIKQANLKSQTQILESIQAIGRSIEQQNTQHQASFEQINLTIQHQEYQHNQSMQHMLNLISQRLNTNESNLHKTTVLLNSLHEKLTPKRKGGTSTAKKRKSNQETVIATQPVSSTSLFNVNLVEEVEKLVHEDFSTSVNNSIE